MGKIRIGISACLLGENVRYDSGHALDSFLRDTLGKSVEYVPVCPEVECGFGIPREKLQLMGDPNKPRLVVISTGEDHTERLETWARRRVSELEKEKLCGFIFKSNSPSCGMEHVKVFDLNGSSRKVGVGIFARILRERFPLIPVTEEVRLQNLTVQKNFLDLVFTATGIRLQT